MKDKEVNKTTDKSTTIEQEFSCEDCIIKPEECENLESRKAHILAGIKEDIDKCPYQPSTSLFQFPAETDEAGILNSLTKREMKLCEDKQLVKYWYWGKERSSYLISNTDILKARERLEELYKKSYPNVAIFADYKKRIEAIFFTDSLTKEEAFVLITKLDF